MKLDKGKIPRCSMTSQASTKVFTMGYDNLQLLCGLVQISQVVPGHISKFFVCCYIIAE